MIELRPPYVREQLQVAEPQGLQLSSELQPHTKHHIEPHQYLQEHVKEGIIFH